MQQGRVHLSFKPSGHGEVPMAWRLPQRGKLFRVWQNDFHPCLFVMITRLFH